jgi:hypothetical protein
MITDLEIISKFYQILNIPAITGVITGEIWNLKKPVNRQEEDIVINLLTNNVTSNLHLLTGVANINTFIKANDDHTPNGIRIKEINDLIIAALNIDNNEGSVGLLTYRLESQKTFRDNDDPTMYFSNLRLKFTLKTE